MDDVPARGLPAAGSAQDARGAFPVAPEQKLRRAIGSQYAPWRCAIVRADHEQIVAAARRWGDERDLAAVGRKADAVDGAHGSATCGRDRQSTRLNSSH